MSKFFEWVGTIVVVLVGAFVTITVLKYAFIGAQVTDYPNLALPSAAPQFRGMVFNNGPAASFSGSKHVVKRVIQQNGRCGIIDEKGMITWTAEPHQVGQTFDVVNGTIQWN